MENILVDSFYSTNRTDSTTTEEHWKGIGSRSGIYKFDKRDQTRVSELGGKPLNQDHIFTRSNSFDVVVRFGIYKIENAQLLELLGVIPHSKHKAFAIRKTPFIRREQCVADSFIYRNSVLGND